MRRGECTRAGVFPAADDEFVVRECAPRRPSRGLTPTRTESRSGGTPLLRVLPRFGFQAILGHPARMAVVFDGTREHQARQRIVFGDQHVHHSFPPPASACRWARTRPKASSSRRRVSATPPRSVVRACSSRSAHRRATCPAPIWLLLPLRLCAARRSASASVRATASCRAARRGGVSRR